MALLDFIKLQQHPQTTPKPAPQTPKADAQKEITKALSPAQLASVREIGERLQKATSHIQGNAQQPSAADGSNAALLQKQNNQEKTQAALSPTDQFAGQSATQKKARGWER